MADEITINVPEAVAEELVEEAEETEDLAWQGHMAQQQSAMIEIQRETLGVLSSLRDTVSSMPELLAENRRLVELVTETSARNQAEMASLTRQILTPPVEVVTLPAVPVEPEKSEVVNPEAKTEPPPERRPRHRRL